MELATLQEWIKTTAIHGLGFVLLACVCFILIFFSWHFTNYILTICKEIARRLPAILDDHQKMMQALTSSSTALRISLEDTQEEIVGIRSEMNALKSGLVSLADAAHSHIRHGKDSDIIIHLNNARNAFSSREQSGQCSTTEST